MGLDVGGYDSIVVAPKLLSVCAATKLRDEILGRREALEAKARSKPEFGTKGDEERRSFAIPSTPRRSGTCLLKASTVTKSHRIYPDAMYNIHDSRRDQGRILFRIRKKYRKKELTAPKRLTGSPNVVYVHNSSLISGLQPCIMRPQCRPPSVTFRLKELSHTAASRGPVAPDICRLITKLRPETRPGSGGKEARSKAREDVFVLQ
ncbi:hypothetical protein F4677DRAFT_443174 [Hypoxylon crocopeplum]|nr:hypothetical protein F4677DRAFT_443174 [Hypoxylon crocopeplum]